MFYEFLMVMIGCITIASVIEKVLKHRREMAKIEAGKPASLEVGNDLRSQLADWKQTSSEFDLSLESNQQQLARRLDGIERRLEQIEQSQTQR